MLARSFARRAAKAMTSVAAVSPVAGTAADEAHELAAMPMSYVDAQLRTKVVADAVLVAPRPAADDVALLAGLDGHGSAAG